MLLTIIVPSFKREKLLQRLHDSIPDNSINIEFLVGVDNGANQAYNISLFPKLKIFNYKKIGRYQVLKNLCFNARGKYIMISDDDDFFIYGQLQILYDNLVIFDKEKKEDEIGIVFNCNFLDKYRKDTSCMPKKIDLYDPVDKYDVQHDLKQVIDTAIMKKAFSAVKTKIGRIPTSLLWLYAGDYGKVHYLNKSVMVKDYKQDGMSTDVKTRKIEGREGYQELYNEIIKRYNKRNFRKYFIIKAYCKLVYSYYKFKS
jgi:glycosyltransferase involved in cell wall biosynthesis